MSFNYMEKNGSNDYIGLGPTHLGATSEARNYF
jgi:hypothetical protein